MDFDKVRDAVTKILQDEVGWEGPLPDGALDQNLDSLQRMTLVVAIEDHFQIIFQPEDEAAIRNLDDLLSVIVLKTAEQS